MGEGERKEEEEEGEREKERVINGIVDMYFCVMRKIVLGWVYMYVWVVCIIGGGIILGWVFGLYWVCFLVKY